MAEGEMKADFDNRVIQVEAFCPVDKSEEVPNPMVATESGRMGRMGGFLPEKSCVPPGTFTLRDRQYKSEAELLAAQRYKKAGPKTHLYYDPNNVKAAIVTCGGLCPGENVVVREIVMMLWYGYGVRNIVGVKYGYEGFYRQTHNGEDCYVTLMPDFPAHLSEVPMNILAVKDIHTLGGTILASSRGGFDGNRIVDSLERRGINQVFAIGGDGTHRGLLALSKIIKERRSKITLIGIPKTIDNDMPLIDKTFGFDSAVEVAMWAIQCADVEANCAEYGVGLVKLMGRYAGHIAMHASLANRDVNICLIPEFPFDIYGPKGVLEYIMSRLRERHHCVIVVSEGAATGMRDVKLQSKSVKDPSGNIIPAVDTPSLRK
jgi:6-phosphofructokinase 1